MRNHSPDDFTIYRAGAVCILHDSAFQNRCLPNADRLHKSVELDVLGRSYQRDIIPSFFEIKKRMIGVRMDRSELIVTLGFEGRLSEPYPCQGSQRLVGIRTQQFPQKRGLRNHVAYVEDSSTSQMPIGFNQTKRHLIRHFPLFDVDSRSHPLHPSNFLYGTCGISYDPL
uniref:Uncharacterized protein n=1 Tax=Anopheles farauti TaxID=69004 RepID=A0A182Q755_9DIPT